MARRKSFLVKAYRSFSKSASRTQRGYTKKIARAQKNYGKKIGRVKKSYGKKISKVQKDYSKKVEKVKKSIAKRSARNAKIKAANQAKSARIENRALVKSQKATHRAFAKAERKKHRDTATRARRAEAKLQRKRDKLGNNRAVGGISNAARAHIGDGTVSLAEAIIISRLQKKGRLKDYSHEQIKDMALRMIGARGRSVGFLAAGWLPSIEKLARAVGQTFHAGAGLKAFNKNAVGKLGFAIPANNLSWRPFARIVNHANAKKDHTNALIKYGQPALRQAFQNEIISMKAELEKKMRGSAKSLGIKTR